MHQNTQELSVVTADVKKSRGFAWGSSRLAHDKAVAHRAARRKRNTALHVLREDYEESSVNLGHSGRLTGWDIC